MKASWRTGVEMHSKRLKRNYVEPIGPKMKVLMDLLRHTKRTGAVIVTHGAKSLNWALFEMCTVQCIIIFRTDGYILMRTMLCPLLTFCLSRTKMTLLKGTVKIAKQTQQCR